MVRDSIADLIAQLHNGKIDRREFVKRAGVAGLSLGLIGNVLRAQGASAQDATPAASPASGGSIGVPGVTHMTDTSKGKIKFYSSWPLSGASEQIGGDSVESVKMALEDFGSAAGGFAIEYEALEDGVSSNNGNWDAGVESGNANKALNDEDCMVYIGTYNSGAAKISIPLLNNKGGVPLAMISPANTYPGLTQAVEGVTDVGEPEIYYPSGKRNYMRNTVGDHLQGGAQANWAMQQGFKKAYVLHDKQLYGQGVALAFQLYFKQLGGEVAGFEGYTYDADNFQSLATSIADKDVDVVMIGAIVNQNPGKVIQDLRGSMSAEDVAIITPDGCFNQAFIDQLGEDSEGVYTTFGGVPPALLDSNLGVDWNTRITARLGHDPDAYATYAYEATVIAMQAIDQVQEKDRQKILDTMFATKEFQGLSGQYSFLPSGDPDKPAIFLGQIKDGKFEKVDYISPAAS